MKRLYLISAATACLVVFAVSAVLWKTQPTNQSTTDQPVNAAVSLQSDSPVIPGANGTSLTPEQQQLLQNPETLSFSRHLEFQEDVRDFFQQADSLTATERQNQMADIQDRLEHYERDGKVSGPEGLMVRIAMIKLNTQDPEAQKEAVSALVSQYQAESKARHQAWLNQPKPEFEAYKKQEKQIVAEVMAMETIPNGLDRNEYLRQRLLQARIAAENQVQ